MLHRPCSIDLGEAVRQFDNMEGEVQGNSLIFGTEDGKSADKDTSNMVNGPCVSPACLP